MGGLMVGVTLSLTLTSVLVEGLFRWEQGVVVLFPLLAGIGGSAVLSALSALPFVVGAHAAARTGQTRLLFSVCLILFFVGLALRAFLFFDHVQARTQGVPGAEGALAVLIGEPLASTAVLGGLWGLLRPR
jgi:hypothetical protein